MEEREIISCSEVFEEPVSLEGLGLSIVKQQQVLSEIEELDNELYGELESASQKLSDKNIQIRLLASDCRELVMELELANSRLKEIQEAFGGNNEQNTK